MDIYELVGFIIGDGNLYYNKKKNLYRLELAGNIEEDKDYFKQIQDFISREIGKEVRIFIRKEKKGNSLRLQVNSKSFFLKLISMGLPIGKKTFSIKIPENMLEKKKMVSILRGLFEADGCLYFSKSKKGEYPTYPRIEIKSSSKDLVEQIKNFLENEGFIVYVKKPSSGRTFGVYVHGEKMLQRWKKLVGLNSLKNKSKHDLWKTKGFYMPHTPLKQRLTICGGGTAATAVDF